MVNGKWRNNCGRGEGGGIWEIWEGQLSTLDPFFWKKVRNYGSRKLIPCVSRHSPLAMSFTFVFQLVAWLIALILIYNDLKYATTDLIEAQTEQRYGYHVDIVKIYKRNECGWGRWWELGRRGKTIQAFLENINKGGGSTEAVSVFHDPLTSVHLVKVLS